MPKLRILRSATLAGVGTFKPGTVVVIPNDTAEGWLRNGTARVEDGTPWVPGEEPKTKSKSRRAKSEPTARQLREAAIAKAKAKPKTQIEPDPVPGSESESE